MNNIQEKDWAEDEWHSHTGIDSSCDYCVADERTEPTNDGHAGQGGNSCGPKNTETAAQK